MRAAIGLGTNLGDRPQNLCQAVRSLSRFGEIAAVSCLYESDPIGGPEQADYLNAVLLLDTGLEAEELMRALLYTELSLGRVRDQRWGPRVLDLDLILFGDSQIDLPGLKVPHPRAHQRRFVLEPLFEVWPEATLDGRGSVRSLLPTVSDQNISLFSYPDWPPA